MRESIIAEVELREGEVTEKRRRVIETRVDGEATKQLRKKGLINNDGEPVIYSVTRPSYRSHTPSTPMTPANNSSLFHDMEDDSLTHNRFSVSQTPVRAPNVVRGRGSIAARGRGGARLCYPQSVSSPPPGPSKPQYEVDEDEYGVPDPNANSFLIDGEIVPIE